MIKKDIAKTMNELFLVFCIVNIIVIPICMAYSFAEKGPVQLDGFFGTDSIILIIYLMIYIASLFILFTTVSLVRLSARKGQMTVFIIIGIILLVSVIFMIFFTQLSSKDMEKATTDYFNTQSLRINDYVSNCFRATGQEGLIKLGIYGGYTEIPEFIDYNKTSIWYLEERNLQPSLEEAKARLEQYVDDNIGRCLNMDEFTQNGFDIKIGEVKTTVSFNAEDTRIDSEMSLEIRYNGMSQSFNTFAAKYDIPFRRIWEVASRITNRFFAPDFDHKNPLDKVDKGNFELELEPQSDERYIIFRIKDTEHLLGASDYKFRFAYKNGPSTLKRTIALQDNCESVPMYKPYIAYSTDRDAQLIIQKGTTFNTPDGVCEISIQQSFNDTAMSLPFSRSNIYDGQMKLKMLGDALPTRWKMNHPVYNIEKTGTTSSKPMKLKIYWDEDYTPKVGEMGIITNHGGYWHPIDSNPVYSKNYVWTDINGFSSYSIIDCGIQMPQTAEAKDIEEPQFFLICILVDILEWLTWPISLASEDYVAAIRGYDDKETCVSFTPTCDGFVKLKKEENKGSGDCRINPDTMTTITTAIEGIDATIKLASTITSNTTEGTDKLGSVIDTISPFASLATAGGGGSTKFLQGGKKYKVCAKVKKCDILNRIVCQKCNVKCEATYV